MKVRFVTDYQGQHTGPHYYLAGQTVEVVDSAALSLIADGRVVEVKPKRRRKPKRHNSA